MSIRIFILCCLLTTILCAPVKKKVPGRKVVPAPTVKKPNINLPDSILAKTKYELLGGGFEGDMIFPKGLDPISLKKRKGVAAYGSNQWPNGVIPYDLSAITSKKHRDLIVESMQILMYAVATPISGETNRKACIYFRPRERWDRAYFPVVYGDGCSATVGYPTFMPAKMTLYNPGCFKTGIIQHELLHILGFFHEQSRPDRDSHITINYDNIEKNMAFNFDKLQWSVSALNQNTPYDYGSIMHYPSIAFSSNGKPTIVPKKSSITLGQREVLSEIDILEIRKYYGC